MRALARTVVAAAILAAILAAGSAAAQEGFAAPSDCWTTRGGSPARAGIALTEPLVGPVEVAWTYDAQGAIEGEPLVWEDLVVLAVAPRPGRRELHVLDLLSGERVHPIKPFASDVTLEPALWERRVVVRAASDVLRSYYVAPRRLIEEWSYKAEGAVSAPLLVEDELIVRDGGALVSLAVGRKDPRWRAEGPFHGDPAAAGEHVYALTYPAGAADPSDAFVARLERASGREAGLLFAGTRAKRTGRAAGKDSSNVGDNAASVAVLPTGVYVRHALPHSFGEAAVERMVLDPAFGAADGRMLAGGLRADPAAWGPGWLAPLHEEGRGDSLAFVDQERGLVHRLADLGRHPAFGAPSVALSVVVGAASAAGDGGDEGGVAYAPAGAFDVKTGRILWNSGIDASARVVPAAGTVLVARGTELVALRAPAPPRGEAFVRRGSEPAGGLAVLADGTLQSAPWRGGGGVGGGDGDEVLWLEDEKKAAVRIRSLGDVPRAMRVLVADELGRARAALADAARLAGDAELARTLCSRARSAGHDSPALDAVEAALPALEAREPRTDRERAARIRADAEALERSAADIVWARALALPREAGLAWKIELLRETLARDLEHKGAVRAVRELLPADLVLPERSERAFDAREWLDFVEATVRVPVELVQAPDAGSTPASFAERELAAAAASWRPDLVGFLGKSLLIVTPVDQPGAVARCLRGGELVRSALAEMFGGERAGGDPMVLHLFPTQAEYAKQASGGGGEPFAGLEWTAGHYDTGANVSRIYVPDDEEAWTSVQSTYAHELTHHWLATRCARFFPLAELQSDADLPGFWIAEGIASFVEEFHFDVAAGTWSADGDLSRRLDLLRNAEPGALLAWDELFTLSRSGFARLNAGPEIEVPTSLYLGRARVATPRHFFYAQAAAVTRYLYLAGRGERAALQSYLEAYYTGERSDLAVGRAFQRTAEVLGREALAAARAGE